MAKDSERLRLMDVVSSFPDEGWWGPDNTLGIGKARGISLARCPHGHGEVVLMVDVPRERVHEIEHRVSPWHREAGLGGVGWTVGSPHL